MKKPAALTAVALTSVMLALFVSLPSAQAATMSGQFDVTINLTAACEIGTLPTAAFTYTGGQTANATFSSAFNIRCTNGLLISSIALDQTSVVDAATNLSYTLALGAVPSSGNGSNQSITLTGTMAGGQGGTCGAATCTNASSNNKRRTLTITY